MHNPHAVLILAAAALAVPAALAALGGCADARSMDSQEVVFDAASPPKEMYHITVVPDPFGGPGKALAGGPPGPSNKTAANKCTFIDGEGFFVMPRSDKAELHLRVGVRGLREVRVAVLAKNPKGRKDYRATLPAADAWQEVVMPLDPAVFEPGSAIYDITVFQLGRDKQAELYVGSLSLRSE